MRFALVTDVHFGPAAYFEGRLRKLSHEAGRLLGGFVERMNQSVRPDLVVNLGDAIEDESTAADRDRYTEFLSVLSRLQAPLLHVAGNHDSVHLDDAALGALWQHQGPLYYSRDVGGVHFVVLRTEETKDVAVHLAAEQIDWLAADLAGAALPAIVLTHHPASDQSLEGNRWFEKAPHICRIAERKELRAAIAASGKVLGVFNGHAHWNHVDVIAGIPYITLQSLVENLDEDAPGRAAAAYAVCDVDDRNLHVHIGGEHELRLEFQRGRPAGARSAGD